MPDIQQDPHPISIPAGYAPAFALGYSDSEGALSLVRQASPLPVELRFGPATASALEGTANASTAVGPFAPSAGRPVMLCLSGEWSGSVTVTRSTDGGTTRHPLTVAGNAWARFTGNVCEPVWSESEAGAELYLEIELDSGTLDYRVSQ